jgi:predicted RNase H-like HicB family nuclease
VKQKTHNIYNKILKMDKETLRMQMLAGVITEGQYVAAINQEVENTEKDSLNEHYVAGGIVGIGAITQIPSRAKADYEDAFEHFLGQKYEIKEEMEEVKEGGNDWWVRADEELGLDFDGENLEDLVMNADESWQADFAQQVLDIDASDYEDYKNQVSTIYDETNPF